MASITECPGGVFLPASAQRESGEAGHESTADSPWTKPGGAAVCVCFVRETVLSRVLAFRPPEDREEM